MVDLRLTETEQKFFNLMSDGNRHSKAEFIELLPDPLSGDRAIADHIYRLRKKLQNTIEDVVCEYALRRTTYRRVRKLHSQGE